MAGWMDGWMEGWMAVEVAVHPGERKRERERESIAQSTRAVIRKAGRDRRREDGWLRRTGGGKASVHLLYVCSADVAAAAAALLRCCVDASLLFEQKSRINVTRGRPG